MFIVEVRLCLVLYFDVDWFDDGKLLFYVVVYCVCIVVLGINIKFWCFSWCVVFRLIIVLFVFGGSIR